MSCRNSEQILATQLPNLHKNSFHAISKEAFQEQVNILSKKIDKLNDDQIITEMMRLVALTGDAKLGRVQKWKRSLS